GPGHRLVDAPDPAGTPLVAGRGARGPPRHRLHRGVWGDAMALLEVPALAGCGQLVLRRQSVLDLLHPAWVLAHRILALAGIPHGWIGHPQIPRPGRADVVHWSVARELDDEGEAM